MALAAARRRASAGWRRLVCILYSTIQCRDSCGGGLHKALKLEARRLTLRIIWRTLAAKAAAI